MKLYISEGAVWFLVVFYTPLALLVLWFLWRKLPKQLPIRIGGLLIASILAAAIPLWDVIITSLKMAELCPQAGLFVKRSVRVEGFYTNFGSPDMLDRGFKYIESRSVGDRIVVYTKDSGAVKKVEFDAKQYQVKSRYEFVYDSELGSFYGRRDIGIQKSIVRDRETNEELGYALRYIAFPGWVDRNTVALIGKIGWTCDSGKDQDTILKYRVLLPK